MEGELYNSLRCILFIFKRTACCALYIIKIVTKTPRCRSTRGTQRLLIFCISCKLIKDMFYLILSGRDRYTLKATLQRKSSRKYNMDIPPHMQRCYRISQTDLEVSCVFAMHWRRKKQDLRLLQKVDQQRNYYCGCWHHTEATQRWQMKWPALSRTAGGDTWTSLYITGKHIHCRFNGVFN